MYEWLPRRLEQAMKVFQEFSLDWTFVLNEPASEASIKSCELELGLILPPSYREFLLQFNGAHLFCTEGEIRSHSHSWWVDSGLMIQGTDTLVLFNQDRRANWISQEGKSLIPFCYLGRIGTGDFCALDPQQLDDSEYAVLDCDHELVPSEWRQAKVASSFEEWLKKLFNQVIDQKNFPEYWFDVELSSSGLLERERTSALMRQGCKKAETGDYPKAISDFNKVLEIEPQHTVAYYERGNAYLAQGNPEAAIKDYNQVLKFFPQNSMAYNKRGLVHLELGDYQGALEDYNQALQLNSSFTEAYINRGNVRSYLGDSKGAQEDYKSADALTRLAATFNQDRIHESGNLVDYVLEEIQPRQAQITCTLIQGQESVCADQDDFDEFNENLTFSDD